MTLEVKNRKLHFSTKIGPKKVFRGLKSIPGRKMKNSNFRLNMDPRVQKSIFGQKIESSYFWPKLAQKIILGVLNRFLPENEKFNFLIKNGSLRSESKIPFFDQKLAKKRFLKSSKIFLYGKRKSQIFDEKWHIEVANRFFVKNWKNQIFDQKSILEVKNRFFVKKSKVTYFD